MIEEIDEMEYQAYISKLKNKPILKLDNQEMSDVISHILSEACEKNDWKELLGAIIMLLLYVDRVETINKIKKSRKGQD